MSTVGQKRIFPDSNATYEYHPGSHVKLRVSGFVVSVYKPLAKQVYRDSNRYYTEPKIEISTNATVLLNIQQKNLMDKAIMAAIDILNSEPDGRKINLNTWQNNDNSVILDKPLAKPVKTKTVLPKLHQLFETANWRQYIYLGYGYFYTLENGRLTSELHRFGHIYAEVVPGCSKKIAYDAIILDKTNEIEAYASEKRAVRILQDFNDTFNSLVCIPDSNTRYVYFIMKKDKKQKLNYAEQSAIERLLNNNPAVINKLNRYLTTDF